MSGVKVTPPSSDSILIEDDSCSSATFEKFENLLKTKLFSDYIIHLKDCDMETHAGVLFTRIPFFFEEFRKGKVGDKIFSEISFPTLTSKNVMPLLSYAYTGRTYINKGNVQQVLLVSKAFGLQDIQKSCSCFIIERLSIDCLHAIWCYACASGLADIVEGCFAFMRKNFESILSSAILPFLKKSDLKILLDSEDLVTPSEKDVFRAIQIWTEKQNSSSANCERAECLVELLQCIRWNSVPIEFIRNEITMYPPIHQSLECRDLLDEVSDWLLRPESMAKRKFSLNLNYRNCFYNRTAFLICTTGASFSVKIYHTETEKTESVSTLKPPNYCAYAVLNGCLFMIGGEKNGFATNEVHVMNLNTNKLSIGTPMNYPRYNLDVCSSENEVYAFGGYDTAGFFEVYSKISNKWTNLPNSNVDKRRGNLIRMSSGTMYVIGGYDIRRRATSSVERFIPIFEKEICLGGNWKSMAPMRTARYCSTMVIHQDAILVLENSSVEMFQQPNSSTDIGQWTVIAGVDFPSSPIFIIGNVDYLTFFEENGSVSCYYKKEERNTRPESEMTIVRRTTITDGDYFHQFSQRKLKPVTPGNTIVYGCVMQPHSIN